MPSASWSNLIEGVSAHLAQLAASGCDIPFFRGHSDGDWKLLCGLGRKGSEDFKKQNIESILYYDFMSLGGPALGKGADSWDVLFAMRHHGLPTRLLDWSGTFAVALYFAIQPYEPMRHLDEPVLLPRRPSIWILDPFELNRLSDHEAAVANPQTDFDGSYQENFIERTKSMGGKVVAINPVRVSARQVAQRSAFTLHEDLFLPIEDYAPKVLRRFDVPLDCLRDALAFLELAGVNEYTLFPDLDGLARHLRREHVSWF